MLLLVTCLYPLDGMGHQQRVKVRLFLMRLLMMIRLGAIISTIRVRADLVTYGIAAFPVFIRVITLEDAL
jgi:hypothetical protein